jgi:hypothetical protein
MQSIGFSRETDYPILSDTRTICLAPTIRSQHFEYYNFLYPHWLFPSSSSSSNSQSLTESLSPKPKFFISKALHAYNAVTRTLRANGWTQTHDKQQALLIWIKPKSSNEISAKGKGNHFPGSGVLGNKAKLAKSVKTMEILYPEMYRNVIPETYLIPEEREIFREKCHEYPIWIYKPSNGSCGSGILVFREFEEIPEGNASAVVSKYVMNPLLIDRLKFDIRIYVLITSFTPLRIYLFDDGLVRFATEPFDMDLKYLNCLNMHLSNFSLNKKSENFSVDKEDCIKGCQGSKWSFKGLLDFLEKSYQRNGISGENVRAKVLAKIKDLVIRTIFSSEHEISSKVGYTNSFFELYGFDILLDDDLNAWLMEVNIYPSLSSSSKLDKVIKTTLVTDMLNLACVPVYTSEKIRNIAEEKQLYNENLKQIQKIIEDFQSKYPKLFESCSIQDKTKLESLCVSLLDEVTFLYFSSPEMLMFIGEHQKSF